MILRMRKETAAEENSLSPITPEIDTLILLDRDVDMVTPMMTMLTYEGSRCYFCVVSTYCRFN